MVRLRRWWALEVNKVARMAGVAPQAVSGVASVKAAFSGDASGVWNGVGQG
jgi:hypothetical protein